MQNKRVKHLPEHWQKWVENHPQLGKGMAAPEFKDHCVTVHFEDGSYMFFEYAFLVEDEEHEDFAVFTEHCGYYSWKSCRCSIYFMTKQVKIQKV